MPGDATLRASPPAGPELAFLEVYSQSLSSNSAILIFPFAFRVMYQVKPVRDLVEDLGPGRRHRRQVRHRSSASKRTLLYSPLKAHSMISSMRLSETDCPSL